MTRAVTWTTRLGHLLGEIVGEGTELLVQGQGRAEEARAAERLAAAGWIRGEQMLGLQERERLAQVAGGREEGKTLAQAARVNGGEGLARVARVKDGERLSPAAGGTTMVTETTVTEAAVSMTGCGMTPAERHVVHGTRHPGGVATSLTAAIVCNQPGGADCVAWVKSVRLLCSRIVSRARYTCQALQGPIPAMILMMKPFSAPPGDLLSSQQRRLGVACPVVPLHLICPW